MPLNGADAPKETLPQGSRDMGVGSPYLPEGSAVWEGNNAGVHLHTLHRGPRHWQAGRQAGGRAGRQAGGQAEPSLAGSLQQLDKPVLNGPRPSEEGYTHLTRVGPR